MYPKINEYDQKMQSVDIFQNQLFFKKKSFRSTIRGLDGLDPDQERHSVGPDLSPNFLQMLLANDKIRHWQSKIVSEYDQEIPQSQTADNPVAPRGRAAQPPQDTRKTNQAKQSALSSPSR